MDGWTEEVSGDPFDLFEMNRIGRMGRDAIVVDNIGLVLCG